jgi:hypothetical protein
MKVVFVIAAAIFLVYFMIGFVAGLRSPTALDKDTKAVMVVICGFIWLPVLRKVYEDKYRYSRPKNQLKAWREVWNEVF